MKILAISGSPRRGGNTDIMVETFVQAAEKNGHVCQIVYLSETHPRPCLACNACRNHPDGRCVQQDDMQGIYEKMQQSDMIVLASPLYYFTVSAQLKALIDRFYAPGSRGQSIKAAALFMDSGSPGYDGALYLYRRSVAFLGWKDMGTVLIPGMKEKGAMAHCPQLQEVVEFAEKL
ncbi:MAG: flavodoxin family protein [Lachnospiraceae bacterium]|nr:flavodoxin family protein [Lachnospiraceae bacterium]